MDYYLIKNKYRPNKNGTIVSSHVVYANDGKDALEFSKEIGLAYPMNSEDVIHRTVTLAFTDIVKRRQKGMGGKIWKREEV